MSRFGRTFVLAVVLGLALSFVAQATIPPQPPPPEPPPPTTDEINKGRAIIDPNG
jgi:hypothetical protein